MVSAETVFMLTALLATGVAVAMLCRDLPIPYIVLLVLTRKEVVTLAEHHPALAKRLREAREARTENREESPNSGESLKQR